MKLNDMKEPTIPDPAKAAGVSVSTVNRVINEGWSARAPAKERVKRAANQIGFYGIGTIEHMVRSTQATHSLGVLLQPDTRKFYRELGEAIKTAAEQHPKTKIDLTLEYLDDLLPEKVAEHILSLG